MLELTSLAMACKISLLTSAPWQGTLRHKSCAWLEQLLMIYDGYIVASDLETNTKEKIPRHLFLLHRYPFKVKGYIDSRT